MNPAAQQRDALIKSLAHLEERRRAVADARGRLVDHAREQLDTTPRTIHIVEQHVDAGVGGGILGHRRLRTLLQERARLQDVVARHQPPNDP